MHELVLLLHSGCKSKSYVPKSYWKMYRSGLVHGMCLSMYRSRLVPNASCTELDLPHSIYNPTTLTDKMFNCSFSCPAFNVGLYRTLNRIFLYASCTELDLPHSIYNPTTLTDKMFNCSFSCPAFNVGLYVKSYLSLFRGVRRN